MQRRKPFPFDQFEAEWQQYWDEKHTFRTLNPGDEGFDGSKPKYYVLDMFPYPSGAGLHVGHPEGYTATDIMARFKRRNGFNVLHPMGWDAFGLPAEQYAIKTGQHPAITTQANVDNFRRQLKMLGFCYDWEREINTTAPDYVRWTQWIFLQLYNSYCCPQSGKARPVSELEQQGYSREQIDELRLAYVAEVPVNWCADLGTVLANEEVDEWKAKGHSVEKRPLSQWMLRITAFAERLIDDLAELDWPESIKLSQINWIGKSVGAEVEFMLGEHKICVYTTRPDTLFGATYMVLAPEHALVESITTPEQAEAVAKYRKACAGKSDLERGELNKDKTGVFTGAYATNPVNGEQIPVWIADYVLMGYGTGAIMAVPAHDSRDFEFAGKYQLPIVAVVQPQDPAVEALGYCEDGISINSGFLDGLPTAEAKKAMTAWLEREGKGRAKSNYKLRDWLFSRQRYWGEPFPIVWENGQHRALSADELPVLQPEMDDFKPTGDPRGPLAKATEWINYSATASRETNTMPQWAGSCWYYLRYIDPANTGRFVDEKAESYWMNDGKCGGVDLYVGGTEHAVLHLLYARFWHKVLFDLGLVSTKEPFHKLVNQGLILGENGQKMSKSLGNVVNPDVIVEEYGADSLRLYEMFMGPLQQVKPWNTSGVEGVSRFLARVWRLAFEEDQNQQWQYTGKIVDVEPSGKLRKVMHLSIKKVGEDIEELSFNTAIAQMMEFCNELYTNQKEVPLSAYVTLLGLLNSFAPHITEELYARLKKHFSLDERLLSEQPWPTYEPQYLIDSEVEVVVQINGKLRERFVTAAGSSDESLQQQALALPRIIELLQNLTVRKIIVIKGKLVNIVAN